MDPTQRQSRRRGAISVEWLGVAVAVILVIAFGVGLVGDLSRTSLDARVNDSQTGILGRQSAAAQSASPPGGGGGPAGGPAGS